VKKLSIILFGILPLLAACGGGGGGGEDAGSGPETPTSQNYQMFRCLIYRQVEGLTGIEYWGSCPYGNWNLVSTQPVFTSLAACENAITVLKNSDPEIYDNSEADRARGSAVKVVCSTPDITPPTVISVSPVEADTTFPIEGSTIHAVFSDNMDPNTFTTTTFTLEDSTGTPVPGTVNYDFIRRTGIFKIDEPLQYVATYTARLTTGITDKVGNPLTNEYSWSFTTGDIPPPSDQTAPTLVVELPVADSVCGLQDGAVTARFDEPIVAANGAFTLEDSNGSLVDGTMTINNTVATFAPAAALDSNEVYTVRLNDLLTDLVGNALSPVDWSFRTELAPEGTWTPIATPAIIAGRAGHTAVWANNEMIIWGGYNWEAPTFPSFQYLTDNGRYDPTLDEWSSISAIDAPRGREGHTATWTGTEMIVWGGTFGQATTNTGGRYNPATDTWSPMSTVGAPRERINHSAIWTGSELVIWGGTNNDNTNSYGDGARYDPVTDTWTPVSMVNAPFARHGHKAVSDGPRMIVWGGTNDGGSVYTDGAAYDSVSDVWTPLPGQGAPGGSGPFETASVASSGADMFVWLPQELWNYDQYADEWYSHYISQARRFDFQNQQWSSVADACDPTATPNAVWLTDRLLSWNVNHTKGQSYNEMLDTWAPITPYPNSIARSSSVVVAGDQVIIWGGHSDPGANNLPTENTTNLGYRLTF